ncbi:AMP-binding protein [Aurantiacibacter spongiae]|uniref:3-methylmercaptopropionyl-CoA ligase n=1 Tax=Aurantiacibacter spongiae TaxID=2488860 RepID=A0A3N5CVY2_9SPHN|nr:AMP-binding protein [Aurantiacibacter spongiae]RPF71660.1 feruloyl-CoA synthetase [Aurantiacibacter spongiae]
MAERRLTRSYCDWFADEAILDCTIGGLLRKQAGRTPDDHALVEGLSDGTAGRRWTYAELLHDADRLARSMVSRYRKGERVAVWAPNIPEWVIIEYAAALAGLTLVTVNPAYQKRELDYILRQSGSAGLFLIEEFRGNRMGEIARGVAGGIPHLREVIDMRDEAAFFGGGDEAASTLPEIATSDPAQIQYTSGTTGFPKGVVLSHRNLANNARLFVESGELEGGATIGLTPLFHTMGCSMSVLGSMQVGATYVPLVGFDPDAALDLMESEKVVWTISVPTMAMAMIEAQRKRPRDLSALRVIGVGGAMVAPELVRAAREVLGAEIRVAYGQTESSPLITTCRPGDSDEDIAGTIGRPASGCEVGIFDPESGDVLPCDTVGEIRARSYATMIGYNDDPEATAAAIDGEGWLHTGDLGRMDDRGFVTITGRVREMIIRGGENLFPAEIENVLLEHPDVAECAVVGVPDERFGEGVAAFVRTVDDRPLDVEALRAHCRAQISAQKCPAHWERVREFPLTGSGKIRKFKLREQWEAEHRVAPPQEEDA